MEEQELIVLRGTVPISTLIMLELVRRQNRKQSKHGTGEQVNRMSDLISRKEAIEKIESHTRVGDELYPLTDTDKILNHAFEISASCVYNLPSAQPEQRWIPCSERLPEHGGRYLISAPQFGQK